ncbi:bifunctional riboflavin biosynthesis protein RIBA 1, chloroplastic-like isoform X2 [Hibiscus syriacus]|uniref:bifunctional riboflavin biosynthesis protein RIBA 1, chloroplastic-like isoform X1 n=1 Tax=Hibiscus syriacus TaxID=106335 RepID=UPI0019241F16|nr:bifunctional riboflavin biosynthesis protein RIBA 1, chloroplastic-like isoform X1 [Hibiscus syriacus]XP_039063033.1 bifunctional riboflavin biosynthesis protein RIBA 1, chloroplastic-like isoform X2 [Hibiscus syriacus]
MASFNVSSPSTASLSRLQASKSSKFFNGSSFVFISGVKTRAALVSGEGNVLSYSNGKDASTNGSLFQDKSVGIEAQ